jgi:hypothetical protein
MYPVRYFNSLDNFLTKITSSDYIYAMRTCLKTKALYILIFDIILAKG